jgi:hypothetical protein
MMMEIPSFLEYIFFAPGSLGAIGDRKFSATGHH